MELTLQREPSTDESTPGTLSVNGVFECFTLEDVVREVPGLRVAAWKVASRTAIPVGAYDVTIDFSQRFGRDMPHILDVEGFDGMLGHSDNTSADTVGCILLGTARIGFAEVITSMSANESIFLMVRSQLVS